MDQQGAVLFFKIPNNVESSICVVISGNTGLVYSYREADIFIEPVAYDH